MHTFINALSGFQWALAGAGAAAIGGGISFLMWLLAEIAFGNKRKGG